MITDALRRSWRFHLEHAGWATPPGRAACALGLARAELAARDEGLELACESDADGWHRFNCDPKPYYIAVLYRPAEHWNEKPEILATLGGIDVDDAESPDYWRVIGAELASEVLH